ncbi:MAG: hypothetical protein IPL59_04805 [Candidatus Competibacteraceae bacterium]|nr:hypothetical protein [Candidatus Competibacteraceae bacterium]
MTVLVVDPSAVVALLKSELGWEALALRLHAAASRVLSAAGRPLAQRQRAASPSPFLL